MTQTPAIIGLAHELWIQIIQDREEIIRAFIASRGCKPEDAIQIEQRMPNGTSRWYVREKDEADLELERRAKEIRERQAADSCPACGN